MTGKAAKSKNPAESGPDSTLGARPGAWQIVTVESTPCDRHVSDLDEVHGRQHGRRHRSWPGAGRRR